jgi:hypothetical protein
LLHQLLLQPLTACTVAGCNSRPLGSRLPSSRNACFVQASLCLPGLLLVFRLWQPQHSLLLLLLRLWQLRHLLLLLLLLLLHLLLLLPLCPQLLPPEPACCCLLLQVQAPHRHALKALSRQLLLRQAHRQEGPRRRLLAGLCL